MTPEYQGRIESGETSLSCNIPIANIKSIPIPNDFEEPLEYEKDGIIYKFRLPRIGDSIIAKEYADLKTLAEREDLMPIIIAAKNDEDLSEYIVDKNGKTVPKFPSKEVDRYLKYVDTYFTLLKQGTQSKFILEVNGKVPSSVEEGIAMIQEIPAKIWMEYTKDISELDFGMDSEVEVISPLTKQATARRFRFQLVELLPTV